MSGREPGGCPQDTLDRLAPVPENKRSAEEPWEDAELIIMHDRREVWDPDQRLFQRQREEDEEEEEPRAWVDGPSRWGCTRGVLERSRGWTLRRAAASTARWTSPPSTSSGWGPRRTWQQWCATGRHVSSAQGRGRRFCIGRGGGCDGGGRGEAHRAGGHGALPLGEHRRREEVECIRTGSLQYQDGGVAVS